MKRTICQGEMVPRWYGIAYHDHLCLAAICYPIPLNKIVGWARFAYLSLLRPPRGAYCHELTMKNASLQRAINRLQADLDRVSGERDEATLFIREMLKLAIGVQMEIRNG